MATNPTLLTMPIAENGQKNTIPATQAAAGDGLLSQSTGFPPETALPLGAGGKAPTREDFNGAFNLLSDIAFYSQKGWTFQYDENQAYYKGCIVMDATDGLRYECINDVAAGEMLPSADTQNEYWREYSPGGVPLGSIIPYAANAETPPYGFLFCEGQAVSREMYPDLFELIGTTYGEGDGENTFNLPNLIDAAMLNGSYTKTSYTTAGSATFTAPKTGFYKITVKGGGGGGGGGSLISSGAAHQAGGGGGEGGTSISYERMTAGQTASVVIGAGGAGGTGANGLNGGASTVTVNLTAITGGGGGGGGGNMSCYGGDGGSGTIPGASGGTGLRIETAGLSAYGGNGGGAGGGSGNVGAGSAGTNGGGGGGSGYYSAATTGGKGGDGYATFEYIGISMKYIGKVYDAPTPSSAQIDLSQYASDLARRLTREQTPAFNKRDVITTSGTYTAPVTGWYRITLKGGGGGGSGGTYSGTTTSVGGSGGGEGGTTIVFSKMTAGQTATVVIGAGGAGGQGTTTGSIAQGAAGGDTTVTVNGVTSTAGGGGGGTGTGGAGGSGTIYGAPGCSINTILANANAYGASGGGNGGARGGFETGTLSGWQGGGGGGGMRVSTGAFGGGAGGNGYVLFEYFDPTLM